MFCFLKTISISFVDIDVPRIYTTDKIPTEEDNFTLWCTIDAHPNILESNWVWKHNGKVIGSTNQLFISKLSRFDTGSYECSAKNEAGLRSNKTDVLVECKSNIIRVRIISIDVY